MKQVQTFILLVISLFFSIFLQAQNPTNFTLASVTDSSHFTLSDAKGKFVALHFLLKTECPYCMRFTQEYFSKAATLSNVVQVFIKPDTEKEIAEWAGKLQDNETNHYIIYRDPEAQLAEKFNVANGYAFHGQTVHYPALILINPRGKEVFRYIGKNNRDRFPFEQLKAKIDELTKNGEY